MKRREFVGYLAAGLAATVVDGKAGRSRRVSHSANLLSQRIGVSSWSFRNYFPQTRPRDYHGPDEKFALLDFPHMIADRYKVHHLELVARHFASTEPAYVDELRGQVFRARSFLVNLLIHTGSWLLTPAEGVCAWLWRTTVASRLSVPKTWSNFSRR
jgi:hypothetical protein